MTEEQAYRKFIEALGYIYNSQWKFDIQLYPSKDSMPIFSTSIYGAPTPLPISDSASRIIATLPARINSFDVSWDSKTIAFASSEGVVLYDLTSNSYLRTLNKSENVSTVAWSPDGKKLAVGSVVLESGETGKPHLTVWDASAWKIIFKPEMNADAVFSFGAIAWSPDGNLLAVNDQNGNIVTFDISNGKTISQQNNFIISSQSIAWSPDGSRLIANGDLGYGIRRWRIDTNEFVRLYDPRVNSAWQLAWSPDGQRIASIHDNDFVCFWTVDTNQCDSIIHANTDGPSSLAWSPDGSQLATGGDAIRIWDTITGKMITDFGAETNDPSLMSRYTQLVWRSPNSPLASLEERYSTENNNSQNVVRFWDVKTGRLLFEFRGADDNSSQ